MMTQTHSLIAATLFASPERSVRQNSAILLGSLVPDLAIYILYFWSKFKKIPEQTLWQDVYFTEPMLTITAIGNSLPLYASLLLACICIIVVQNKHTQLHSHSTSNKTHYWSAVTNSATALFTLAAMTHLLGDFPVHAKDAHPHFWPISNWKFESPISYWDQNHHGQVFSVIEAIFGIVLSVILFRRFKSLMLRALMALAVISYIAVPVYFSLML